MKKVILFFAIICFSLTGCEKGFLDKKPDKALLVPTTLNDFQALLDNTNLININPSLDMIAGDEFIVTTNGSGLNALQRNAYFWADDMYEATSAIGDWYIPYQQVFYANIVLDGLEKVNRSDNRTEYDRIKGSALFIRACAFYNLAQLFAVPYTSNNAFKPGIPLSLSSNVNTRPSRGTLQQTYDQIVNDLKEAVSLLPKTGQFKSRPSNNASLALLARTYLTMQDYDNALRYADLSLSSNNNLINYNTLDAKATYPFPSALPNGNDEVLYNSERISYAFFRSNIVKFTDELRNAYEQNDLRKTLFFLPSNGRFRGYVGLTVAEMYLIRAESNCRLNKLEMANSDLNKLLSNRYLTGKYVPLRFSDQASLLAKILIERKKELVARGLRWSDLRRLNQDPATSVTLKRIRDGIELTLLPNSNKYTFPIPLSDLGDGVIQNPR